MSTNVVRRLARDKKGQALVEYALIVACVALVCAVSITMLGHKTADVIAIAAAVMPGAADTDNAPINTGRLIPTKLDTNGNITIDGGNLVAATTGIDRYAGIFDPGTAATLVNE